MWTKRTGGITCAELNFIKKSFPNVFYLIDDANSTSSFNSDHTITVKIDRFDNVDRIVIGEKLINDTDGSPLLFTLYGDKNNNLIEFEITRMDGDKINLDLSD